MYLEANHFSSEEPVSHHPSSHKILNRQAAVSAEVPSMTDADGNVIAYDVANVKLPMKDGGL